LLSSLLLCIFYNKYNMYLYNIHFNIDFISFVDNQYWQQYKHQKYHIIYRSFVDCTQISDDKRLGVNVNRTVIITGDVRYRVSCEWLWNESQANATTKVNRSFFSSRARDKFFLVHIKSTDSCFHNLSSFIAI